jgi:TetR/AcrR family transcriptional repressor of nem operon
MFRLRGLEGVSVSDIMKECGFTHGGFYNHFESKEQLATEAVECAFVQSTDTLVKMFEAVDDPQKAFEMVVAAYLSPSYRDSARGGCPAAAMPTDAARGSEELQRAFAEGVQGYLELFSTWMDAGKPEGRQRAIALLSGLVGALCLSRAIKKSSPKLSEEILKSARKHFSRESFRKV